MESASPTTPQDDGHGGMYDMAKMADLDPLMQFRSEVYGLRIYVCIPGGGGFSGLFQTPQLRDLYFGRGKAGIDGVQVAVGTWHQRLTDLVWEDPQGSSPVYSLLKAQATNGLDVKMSVDMYQTKRANVYTQGDRFGYGRLMASIGPAAVGEPYHPQPFH